MREEKVRSPASDLSFLFLLFLAPKKKNTNNSLVVAREVLAREGGL